jgi:hypothetical protein
MTTGPRVGVQNMGQEALACLTAPALASCLETVAIIATDLATDGEGAALTDITEGAQGVGDWRDLHLA